MERMKLVLKYTIKLLIFTAIYSAVYGTQQHFFDSAFANSLTSFFAGMIYFKLFVSKEKKYKEMYKNEYERC